MEDDSEPHTLPRPCGQWRVGQSSDNTSEVNYIYDNVGIYDNDGIYDNVRTNPREHTGGLTDLDAGSNGTSPSDSTYVDAITLPRPNGTNQSSRCFCRRKGVIGLIFLAFFIGLAVGAVTCGILKGSHCREEEEEEDDTTANKMMMTLSTTARFDLQTDSNQELTSNFMAPSVIPRKQSPVIGTASSTTIPTIATTTTTTSSGSTTLTNIATDPTKDLSECPHKWCYFCTSTNKRCPANCQLIGSDNAEVIICPCDTAD